MSAKVLVTGGAGFIGSVLVSDLIARGAGVTVLDAVPWADAWRLQELDASAFAYTTVDTRDLDALAGVVGGHDIVFHLSSNTENRAALADADADYTVTVGGTVSLLRALAAAPPAVMVLASSQLVYGAAAGRITEQTPTSGPRSRFAAGKLAAEAFLSAYAYEYGMRAAACRLSNIVGSGMRRGIVHDFVRRLRVEPDRLRVLGNGQQTRSYLHVSDCVSALLVVGGAAKDGFATYNVCNMDTTSAASVAEIVAEAWPGHKRPVVEVDQGEKGWADDVPTLLVRPERLQRLGWRPRYGSDDAVRQAAIGLIADQAA
jgi:UDP-glucose 4-epimerase